MAMLQTTIPEGYKTKLNLYDTQNAIALIKGFRKRFRAC